MGGFAAVILAGGAGRRLGGAAKPLLTLGGRTLLARVLAAVPDAAPVVVVGPATLQVPPGVVRVSEEPPGGGPVAALAAGLAAAEEPNAAGPSSAIERPGAAEGEFTALLAADLPFLTAASVALLRAGLQGSTVDGVVYVDTDGRRQTLCGVWRTGALRAALRAALRDRPSHHGAALRDLLAGLRVQEVSHEAPGPPPWYDCDSPEDLDRAKGWV
jgi:molybdopterin-guanine dinucleotide biosynthesis protein A